MDLNHICIFLTVCEELNFSTAAKRLNVSQPTVSRAIQALEAHFGGPLVRRERQRTHLTELGRIVQPYLERITASLGEADQAAGRYGSLSEAMASIGIMCTIAATRLMPLIGSLAQNYAGLQFRLQDGTAGQLEERLLDGQLDIAICGKPKLYDERFQLLPLYSELFVAVLSPDHPLAGKSSLTLAELVAEPFVARVQCEFDGDIQDLLLQKDIRLSVRYAADRDDWALDLVRAGQGVSFMPVSAVSNRDVIALPVTDFRVRRQINITTVRGRRHTPGIAALLAQARKINWQDLGGEAVTFDDGAPGIMG